MTNYHAWKRRLWGPNYPVENGPPYQDPATGAPMLPGGIVGGPYQGIDDNGPQSGNPVVLTFTGPATGDATVGVLILDETAGAPAGGRWVGCTANILSGDTATVIGDKIAAAFNAKDWAGWGGGAAVNAAGTVTFTPIAAGSAEGWVIYGVSQSGVSGGVAPTPIGTVGGPFNSPHGQVWWIQKTPAPTKWYYWTDIDGDPQEPNVRAKLREILDNTSINIDYRNDVYDSATGMGFTGNGPA